MVLLEMHACLNDQQIAVGKGDTFAQAAQNLRAKIRKVAPELLTLDLDGVLGALRNEHFCETVGTRSNTGMFLVLRVNAYKRRMSLFSRLTRYLSN